MAKKSATKAAVKPLGTRVLLQEYEEDFESGGILLPEEAKDSGDLRRAEVLAVGDGVGSEEEKIELSVGDKVLLDGFSGRAVKINGEDYLIAKSTDIMAVLK